MTGTRPNKRHPLALPPFAPEDWQVRAWRDKAFLLLLTGSAGGGKSRLAAEKLHALCLKYPGTSALMLRKTRESTTNSIVLFMRHAVMGSDRSIRHLSSHSRFEYPNGSLLLYGGMKNDEQREQIRSIGKGGAVDFIWLEEATQFSELDFNELLARVRGNAAGWRQIIMTTNPGPPTHWIYKRLIQGKEASVYYSGALDNSHNPPEYLNILNSMTGILRARLVEGKWVQAEGAVYEEFDPAIHVLDKVPDHLRRFIASVDWGYTNPGVIQIWGVDNDGRMVMVHETYKTGWRISQWVSEARRLARLYPIERFICDPAEPAYIEDFRLGGLNAIPADNEIRKGIDVVKERLAVQPDGKPRLMVYVYAHSDPDPLLEQRKLPANSLDEFPAYVWPKGVDGREIKEIPVDANNHGLDCVRYAAMALDVHVGVLLAQL